MNRSSKQGFSLYFEGSFFLTDLRKQMKKDARRKEQRRLPMFYNKLVLCIVLSSKNLTHILKYVQWVLVEEVVLCFVLMSQD